MTDFSHADVLAFLKQEQFMYLSVASPEAKPFGSTVLFDVDDEFNIFFLTHKESRKSHHLSQNPYGAVVIGHEKDMNVQATGRVEVVRGDRMDELYEALAEKILEVPGFYPPLLRTSQKTDFIGFMLKPDWLRALDVRHPSVGDDKNPYILVIGE